MTRTSMTIGIIFGLGFVAAVSAGGGHLSEGRWAHAATAYAVAALCVLGAVREAGRAELPGDYTDDVDEPAPEPVKEAGFLARFRAARAARRVARSMPCDCDRYWSTTGREHDPWCHLFDRSVA
ncbi:hypothetical protein ACFY64_31555 [Streptomyces collinus]|uniref:hypothetical protein n=1 Tax=Streptomyces collinus TaxID=42684 RepID=UPI0036B842E7